MSGTVAEQFAALADQMLFADLPDDLRAGLPGRVLDSLGVSLGALPLDTSAAALGFAQARGGAEQAQVLGHSVRLPAASAAFVNGVLAHSLDFDDTHLPSVLHPSASVVPAALAAAESAGASGEEFLRGVAIGLEVCCRLGMAGYDDENRSSIYFERGQHATSICGTIGAAVAAAVVHRLSADQVVHAIGIGASMGAGILEANRFGGNVKRLHCGWAAQAGVSAVELALAGFTAPATAIEGRFGFLTAFLGDRARPGAAVAGLGSEWEVRRIFFKPYPANHFTHTVVDAAGRLRERGVSLDDVTAIEVRVPTDIVRTIGQPLVVKQAPETAYQAQFSGPYAAVLGLVGGEGLGATLADYTDERATDPRWRAAMAKVKVVADRRCDEIFPHQFPAVVGVTLHDGSVLEEEVLQNRGGPQWPLTDEELGTKFMDNATRWLEPRAAAAVRDATFALPSASSVRGVLAAAAPTAPPPTM